MILLYTSHYLKISHQNTKPQPSHTQFAVVNHNLGIQRIRGKFSPGFCDDLWQFHLGTSLWIRIGTGSSATVDVTPPRRAYHAAAWEDVSAALWIHGGIDAHEVRGGKMAKGSQGMGRGTYPP